MLTRIFVLLTLTLFCSSTSFAGETEKEIDQKEDSLFGEDGSYNVSVDGGGIKVHGEYDKDGKPKSGGAAGNQAIEAVGRDFHDARKAERRERKAQRREEKKKAKEARR